MRTDSESLSVKTDITGLSHELPDDAKEALQSGIKAAQAGNRSQARVFLTRAAELDPHNENAWLWLASISEFPEELLEFLEHVLGINPENERALEWMAATKSLLAKTFVQRGIDALHDNQHQYAAQCFDQALWYDQQNPLAWLWKASLCESEHDKIFYLQRAVDLDPDNGSAIQALNAAKSDKMNAELNKAKSAAVDGRYDEAMESLDAFLDTEIDCAEAWLLRSHLTTDFNEKIMCLDRVLAAEPENASARENRDWLAGVVDAVNPTINHTVANPQELIAEDVPTVEAVVIEGDVIADGQHSYSGPIDVHVAEDHVPIEDFYENFEPETQAVHFEEYENGKLAQEEPASELAKAAQESFEEPEFEVHTGDSFDPVERSTDDGSESIDFMYHVADPDPSPAVYAFAETATEFDTKLDETDELVSIPMPDEELDSTASSNASREFITNPSPEAETEADCEATRTELEYADGADSDIHAVPQTQEIECQFCRATNTSQTIACQSCKAVLTLSDLETLLGNQGADQLLIGRALGDIEEKSDKRDYSEEELTTLALGHLNLRNWASGLSYLQQAAQANSNNVFLSSQANALHIRLEEMKEQKEAHEKLAKGKTILVVDDSPTVCKLVASKLEKCGHEVYCSNDGPEALELLKELVPDLVLLDINMPKMDGYQVCKLIRSNHATQNVPVVMISGKDGFFDKVRGRMAGTTGYMTKPFGPESLMKAVETYLHGEASEPMNP